VANKDACLLALVAFYDIQPANGVGLFFKPRSQHGAQYNELQLSLNLIINHTHCLENT